MVDERDVTEALVRAVNIIHDADVHCREQTDKSLAYTDVLRHLSMAVQHVEAACRLLDVLRGREQPPKP